MPHFTDVIETLYKDLKRKSNVYKEFSILNYPYEFGYDNKGLITGRAQNLAIANTYQIEKTQLFVDLEGFVRENPDFRSKYQIIASGSKILGTPNMRWTNQGIVVFPGINSSLMYSNEDSYTGDPILPNRSFSRFKPYGEIRVFESKDIQPHFFESSKIKDWKMGGPNFRKLNLSYLAKQDGLQVDYTDELIPTLFQVVENDLAGRQWLVSPSD